MKKRLFLVLMSFQIFISCSNNSFESILFRTTDDPFYDTPRTDSDTLENTIYIDWKEDIASDCFYLMRSRDQKELRFRCIYSGTENSFIDIDTVTNEGYVYRLDKKRGNKYFTGNTYSYGYGSSCRKDQYEPNDKEEFATFLEYDLNCNLSCIQFLTEGILHSDVDWFYISLPPKRTAEIIISQKGLGNANVGTDTNLKIQKVGSIEETVTEKSPVYITNPSEKTVNQYFKIYLNNTALFDNSSTYTVVEYTVSLNKIFYRQ